MKKPNNNLLVRVDSPVREGTEGDYSCVVSIPGKLDGDKRIYGPDGMEAISNALTFACKILGVHQSSN